MKPIRVNGAFAFQIVDLSNNVYTSNILDLEHIHNKDMVALVGTIWQEVVGLKTVWFEESNDLGLEWDHVVSLPGIPLFQNKTHIVKFTRSKRYIRFRAEHLGSPNDFYYVTLLY